MNCLNSITTAKIRLVRPVSLTGMAAQCFVNPMWRLAKITTFDNS